MPHLQLLATSGQGLDLLPLEQLYLQPHALPIFPLLVPAAHLLHDDVHTVHDGDRIHCPASVAMSGTSIGSLAQGLQEQIAPSPPLEFPCTDLVQYHLPLQTVAEDCSPALALLAYAYGAACLESCVPLLP